MASAYKNAAALVGSTGDVTIYTCPSATEAIVKNINLFNSHSGAIVVLSKINDSSASTLITLDKTSMASEAETSLTGPFVLEAGGDIACDDSLGESFDNSGLPDAGLANQDRIILCSAIQHLHTPADFLVSADNRVELAFSCHLQKVNSVAFKGLVFVFGCLVGYPFAAANLF